MVCWHGVCAQKIDLFKCVDFRPLNESVLRDVHPLPRVDDTLAQLSGAKVFSKIDANSGFWQVLLATESHLLTTFITPYRCFVSINCLLASPVLQSYSRNE